MGPIRDNAIDTAQHAGGGTSDDAGIGDRSIDAALPEDGLQLCREGSLYANTPTQCVAGANRNNVKRAGMAGPDPKDEHRHCRKSAKHGCHGLALRRPTIMVLSSVIDSIPANMCTGGILRQSRLLSAVSPIAGKRRCGWN